MNREDLRDIWDDTVELMGKDDFLNDLFAALNDREIVENLSHIRHMRDLNYDHNTGTFDNPFEED
jgi:hypothetical protein